MAESEANQTVVMQAATQAATETVMVMREADAGPIAALIKPTQEKHRGIDMADQL